MNTGAGSVLGLPTIKDANTELASAQATLQQLSGFFCPGWSGFPAWKSAFNQAQVDLNAEAQNIASYSSNIPSAAYDWTYYDTSNLDQINLRLLSLNAQVQTASGLCTNVPPGTTPPAPGQTPPTPSYQGPPSTPSSRMTTAVLVGIGAGLVVLAGWWYVSRRPRRSPVMIWVLLILMLAVFVWAAVVFDGDDL